TDIGRDRVEALFDAEAPTGVTLSGREVLAPTVTLREATEAVSQALAALWLYHRDQQYLVADDKVQIIDESTGRAMPDRAWERGLHQAIEAKEGLAISGDRVTLARITYQRFFRRYLRLAGMTGTATEVAAEIGRVYRLPVWRVPLNRPSRARQQPLRCLPGQAAKWDAVVESVRHEALEQGRPVLVGTRTVQASEVLSARLAAAGIAHVVLNAKQDRAEAEVVARAGAPATVTVATNMAGRGTDIELGEGVVERGGLHVIVTEFHESPRVDRQLLGRAARQGDPGSGEIIVALDDELFVVHSPGPVRWLSTLLTGHGRVGRAALATLRWWTQTAAAARNRSLRSVSVEHDRRLAALLAFSGRGE
ncbi:MAG: preprotein translocase subunit SecA, partial [Burkholderiaceae bacterium]